MEDTFWEERLHTVLGAMDRTISVNNSGKQVRNS